MLFDLIIFAVVLVGLNLLTGVIVFKITMSEKFLMYYSKKVMKMSKKLVEEMFDDEEI